MRLLSDNGNLLTVGGKLATANAAPATPYMEAEYIAMEDGVGNANHYIKRAKLYNHTAIYRYEFAGQDQLQNLDFSDASNNITAIEPEAFYLAQVNGLVLPNTITTLSPYCFFSAIIKTLTIPPLVTVLSTGAFQYVQPLVDPETGEETPASIILPQNLVKIDQSGFEGAYIQQITIPNTVTEIGERAFSYCLKLASIVLSTSLQKISNNMLERCTSLTEITIPASVTEIGQNAISGTGITHITIPSTVTTLGSSAFEHCRSLTSMDIQANVTVIPDNFAQECPLTSLTLPNTVQTIGESAFLNSQTLQITELTIPASVIFIGNNAFNSNNAFQMTLTVLPTTPPTFGGQAFNLATGSVIKVPAASVAAYKAADGWKDYASYIVAM